MQQASDRSQHEFRVPEDFDPVCALLKYPNTSERYQEVQARTSNVTKSNQLKNLIWVLLSQARAQSQDYRIATIGKQTASYGGPSEQTIRNANGGDYRILIELFSGEVENSSKKVDKKPANSDEALLALIDSPSARNIVRLALHDRASLQNQLNLLKNQIASHAPPIPTALRSSTMEPNGVVSLSLKLSKSRRGALEHFVSDAAIAAKKWRINEHGALVDMLDFEIARPGFIDALKQILSYLEN